MNNVLSQRVQQAETTLADKEQMIQTRKTESEEKDRLIQQYEQERQLFVKNSTK